MSHTKGELSLNNYHHPHAFIVVRTGSNDNDAFPGQRKMFDINTSLPQYKANAEHIVHCWNAFEDLLEACEYGKRLLLDNVGQTTHAVSLFEAAIAKASVE